MKVCPLPRDDSNPLRLGVLIGGGGRTLLNLHKHIVDRSLPARIDAVIASRDDLPGVQRARDVGYDVMTLNSRTCGSPVVVDDAINTHLTSRNVELVCLAGYLRKLNIHPSFVGRVINIHPALLPSFGGQGMYGERVHRAVLEHGCKVSGCTVHFVDDVYDNGPIILQRCCPVLENDSPDALAARVFELECLAYPEAVRLIAEGRVTVDGRQVKIQT